VKEPVIEPVTEVEPAVEVEPVIESSAQECVEAAAEVEIEESKH